MSKDYQLNHLFVTSTPKFKLKSFIRMINFQKLTFEKKASSKNILQSINMFFHDLPFIDHLNFKKLFQTYDKWKHIGYNSRPWKFDILLYVYYVSQKWFSIISSTSNWRNSVIFPWLLLFSISFFLNPLMWIVVKRHQLKIWERFPKYPVH